MTNNLLSRHKCWLIQTGQFKKGITEITGRKSIIDLNYMGSAEFEWGALPDSTRRMLTNIDFYEVFTFPEYKDIEENEMMVYAPIMFKEHISSIIHNLVEGSLNRDLQEPCYLLSYLNGKNSKFNKVNFWWDIENDFYIFFGEDKKELILEAHKQMRERSIGQIEIGDWDELSNYYSLVNQDLNDEAKEFLKPKKSKLAKRLVKTLNNRVEELSKQKN